MPRSPISLLEQTSMVKSHSARTDAGLAASGLMLLAVVIFLFSDRLVTVTYAGPGDASRATSDGRMPVAGVPPLTGPLMHNARGFVEWALDVQFTPPQTEYFNRQLKEHWRLSDREEIASTVLAGQVYLLLPFLGEGERRQLQLSVRDNLLANLYAESARPENRWLLEIYTAHHPAIRPPVDHTENQTKALENYLKSQNRYNSINSMMNNMF
jgi:hypothetical protein